MWNIKRNVWKLILATQRDHRESNASSSSYKLIHHTSPGTWRVSEEAILDILAPAYIMKRNKSLDV